MTSFGIPKTTPEGLGIPCGIQEGGDFVGRLWTLLGAQALYFLDLRHKKRRPRTSFFVELVEPGGFEPPSASTPLSVLHA